jgi:hypothetical protein
VGRRLRTGAGVLLGLVLTILGLPLFLACLLLELMLGGILLVLPNAPSRSPRCGAATRDAANTPARS